MAGERAMSLRVALVVVALLGPGLATAMFSVEEGGLKVLFPPGNKQRMDMALADFGEPKYGGTMTGTLVYPTSDQLYDGYTKLKCWPSDCQYACSSFNSSMPVYQLAKSPKKKYIMLVDRGPRTDKDNNPCYFLEKVYNAQMAGADAVLVANDEDGDLSTAVAPEDEQYLRELKDLKISAAMITKANADLLRQVLRDSKGQVTVQLNWTNILPRKQMVTWELWTNSNDECGTLCDVQRQFVTAMRSTAQDLVRNNQSTFTPHYLIWSCPLEFLDTTECQTECIMNGTYCVPDPDNDVRVGYNGSDVLMMNIRQLCFFKVANASGKPWLWWDYVDNFGSNCSMAAQKYTEECATQVFTAVGGSDLMGGQGLATWQACTNFDKVNGDVPKPADGTTNVTWFPQSSLLEAELNAQSGTDDESSVSILPTIRINDKQYRGNLDAPGVTRALCSAFPSGQEPPVCNQKWVSDNECDVGSDGYQQCQVAGDSTNRCINTFSGYRCECGVGWMRAADPDSGSERCEDINECLATNVISTNPQCSCDRCACINTVGSYRCTGRLEDKCAATASPPYGGCWSGSVGGATFSACVDTLTDYQDLAARGLVNSTTSWSTCKCPACFSTSADGKTCTAACDLKNCDQASGICRQPASGGGGGSQSKGSSAGASVGYMIMAVLVAVTVTAAVLAAVYRFVLRQRMQDEIRDIMAQYMPLEERPLLHGDDDGGDGDDAEAGIGFTRQPPGRGAAGRRVGFVPTSSVPRTASSGLDAPGPRRGNGAAGAPRGNGSAGDGLFSSLRANTHTLDDDDDTPSVGPSGRASAAAGGITMGPLGGRPAAPKDEGQEMM